MNIRYQEGGDIFLDVYYAYGEDAAYNLARLDAAGDERAKQQYLSDLRRKNTTRQWGSESTAGNLFDQLTTDPLSAPLESANRQLGLAVWNVVKNPFVLVVVLAVGFYYFGGFRWLQKRFA